MVLWQGRRDLSVQCSSDLVKRGKKTLLGIGRFTRMAQVGTHKGTPTPRMFLVQPLPAQLTPPGSEGQEGASRVPETAGWEWGGQMWLVLVGKSWVGRGLSVRVVLGLDSLPHFSGGFFRLPWRGQQTAIHVVVGCHEEAVGHGR